MRLQDIQKLYETSDNATMVVPNAFFSYPERDHDTLLEQAAHSIMENCQPWLSQCGGEFAYRGMRLSASTVEDVLLGKKPVRTDRNPADTPKELHALIVEIFNNLEIPANRHNSMFVNGREMEVGQYGTPYIVFPIGEFHYTWSNVIEDLYHFLWALPPKKDYWTNNGIFAIKPGYNFTNMETFGDFFEKYKQDKVFFNKKKFEHYLDANYINDHELAEAIRSGHEIFIKCNEYYFIEAKHGHKLKDLINNQ